MEQATCDLHLDLDEEEEALLCTPVDIKTCCFEEQEKRVLKEINIQSEKNIIRKKQAKQPSPSKPSAPAGLSMDRQVKFSSLCDMFEKSLDKTHNERLQLITKLWKSIKGHDYYPFMRLLLPQLDKERMAYGLKESKIALYLIEILCIKASSEDALRLKKWKDPSLSKKTDGNCFSDTVYSVLNKRGWSNKSSKKCLSVFDVNDALDALCSATEVEAKKKHIVSLLTNMTSLEFKWLVRIILKDMRYGMQHTSILKEFHPNAVDVWNACTDLKQVTKNCLDPKFKFTASIQIFQAFKPMLASLANPDKLSDMLCTNDLVVEPKYDGERITIHKSDNTIKYFTRNSKDYTELYGHKFNRTIMKCVKIKDCILDGEMLVYSKDLGGFKEFGHNRTFALSDENNTQENFCYMVFDVLHANGSDVLAETLSKRRRLLDKILTTQEHELEIVPQMSVTTQSDIYKALDDAILNREEGIIIKNTSSAYQPGERKNNWIKLKPDHVDGMGETLDMVIVGGYFGTKFNRKSVSHFLLAVRGHGQDDYYTCCKVGSGYTSSELIQLQSALEPHWIKFNKSDVPKFFCGWVPQSGEIPDVYIEPIHSKVLEVKAFSITETTKFKTGYTLRFPRVKRIRDDKNFDHCNTFSELSELVNNPTRRTASSLTSIKGDRGSKRKQRSEAAAEPRKRLKTSVISSCHDTDTSNIKKEGKAFVGKEFVVLSGDAENTKEQLERLIVKHGGTKVQNPSERTWLIVAHEVTLKVINLVEAVKSGKSRYGDKDVVHCSWIVDSAKQDKALPLHPRYMVHTSKITNDRFLLEMDKYQDSYQEESTLISIKKSFENVLKIEKDLIKPLTIDQINVVNQKYKLGPNSCLFLRGCVFYFDDQLEDEMLCLKIKLYGGTISNANNNQVTHVVVRHREQRSDKVVDKSWLLNVIKNKKL
ncbi:DNA ligase [Acrasis kona]|uniref:DNA ligase n=1 Tax=Acrasis kona TaxID=1008807 RepID=A0AAW2YUS1_9EUKA